MIAALAFVICRPAAGYECESDVILAAKTAAAAHEGGNLKVDKTTAEQIIFQRARQTIVWLQVRYVEEEGRRPTQWCVVELLPKAGCGCHIFSDDPADRCKEGQEPGPAPAIRKIVPCTVVPDDVGINRILASVGWPPKR
jgi:hypothetical protein